MGVSAPPASCTKRSAAARSQSWLLPPAKAASQAPCATRASRSASECPRANLVEKFLWTGNANSTQGRAGRRRDRFAVERAAGPGARSEKLVERRRVEAGCDGPVAVDERCGDRPIRLSSDISAGAVDRID